MQTERAAGGHSGGAHGSGPGTGSSQLNKAGSAEGHGQRGQAGAQQHDFKLLVEDVKSGQTITVHLVAPSRQEKEAWITDISQVKEV